MDAGDTVKILDAKPGIEPRPETAPSDEGMHADGGKVFAPTFPLTLEELDVSAEFLVDLTLKTVSMEPECTTVGVAERLRLGTMITDSLLERLYTEKLIEKKGTVSL